MGTPSVLIYKNKQKNAIEISLIACDDIIESQSSAHTSTTSKIIAKSLLLKLDHLEQL